MTLSPCSWILEIEFLVDSLSCAFEHFFSLKKNCRLEKLFYKSPYLKRQKDIRLESNDGCLFLL